MKYLCKKIHFVLIITALLVSCASIKTNGISGTVSEISKYGNITTTVSKAEFDANGFTLGDVVYVHVNGKALESPYGSGYQNVDTGKLIVLSSDGKYISVAINMGNFAKVYDVKIGDEITFEMCEKGGYLEEYETRSVEAKRTNKREDYKSDEVFANFREVKGGDIKSGRLYRSSNPVNPELGRNTYVDALIKKARVKTAMNLADSRKELESYPSYKDSYYSTIDVIPLNMGVDFKDDDFNEKLNAGFVFLSEHDTPYLVHCNEGKDRAGFVNALLECLCGFSFDEVVEDYMTTYENYYFIEKDSAQYKSIAKSNIYKMLMQITDLDTIEEVKKANLSEKSEEYLKNIVRLDESVIKALRSALCE